MCRAACSDLFTSLRCPCQVARLQQGDTIGEMLLVHQQQSSFTVEVASLGCLIVEVPLLKMFTGESSLSHITSMNVCRITHITIMNISRIAHITVVNVSCVAHISIVNISRSTHHYHECPLLYTSLS